MTLRTTPHATTLSDELQHFDRVLSIRLARQAERVTAVRETLQTSGDNYDAVWAWKWIFRPSATGAEADAHSAHIDGEVAHAPADVAYVAHRRGIRCRGHPTAGAASENLDEGASDGCPRPPYEDESW